MYCTTVASYARTSCQYRLALNRLPTMTVAPEYQEAAMHRNEADEW